MGYNESTTNTLKTAERPQANNLTLHLEQLEKKKIKTQRNRRKEIRKYESRGENRRLENQ